MVNVNYEISKEEYEKAKNEGAESLIGESTKLGYGVYSASTYEKDGHYYLTYWRGNSCD